MSVAAHEICHSWTGNDITCENWSNMWLNEGFTTFEERKVTAQIYGLNFAKTEALLANASLASDIANYGSNSSYSALYPIIDEQNPDDSYSNVPYEKGFQFLTYLEGLVTAPVFQKFLQYYIGRFPLSSIGYEVMRKTWEDFIYENIADINE